MRRLKPRWSFVALVAVAFALVAPAGAVAGSPDPLADPSAATYGNDVPNPRILPEQTDLPGNDNNPSSPAAANPSPGLNGQIGGLPFTGADVLILLVVGGVLMTAGITLRRLSDPQRPA